MYIAVRHQNEVFDVTVMNVLKVVCI